MLSSSKNCKKCIFNFHKRKKLFQYVILYLASELWWWCHSSGMVLREYLIPSNSNILVPTFYGTSIRNRGQLMVLVKLGRLYYKRKWSHVFIKALQTNEKLPTKNAYLLACFYSPWYHSRATDCLQKIRGADYEVFVLI